MNRDEVLGVLRAHKKILSQRFGVSELTLFGSVARDQANDDSDVDILVSYGKLLGRQVDLVTDKALREEFRPYVKREAIDV